MKRGLAPQEVLADSLYGSDDNVQKAKEQGVEVIAPTMGTQTEKISLVEFSFSDDNEITHCPEGLTPLTIKTGKKGGKIVHFDRESCDRCLRQTDCPANRTKGSATLSYDAKALRLARRRAREKTEEYREAYRFRSGIEGTMSDLDRITGIKHLRVRGMPQVELAATLKVTGLNILRAVAFKKRINREGKKAKRANHDTNDLVWALKEQFSRLLNALNGLFGIFSPGVSRSDCFATQKT